MASAERHLPTLAETYPRTRTGGSRTPRPTRFERHENVRTSILTGSHMPLDTEVHWTWRNPLNILPAIFLVVLLIAVIGTLVVLM